jgi:hypothetical protein
LTACSVVAWQQAEVIMNRVPSVAYLTVCGRWAAGVILCGGLALASDVRPALAKSTATPGSTINGTVPTSEGNVWNGLDHQPTPSEVAPINNPQQQSQVNHTLNHLDNQLLNQPLPKVPAGAPPVQGN